MYIMHVNVELIVMLVSKICSVSELENAFRHFQLMKVDRQLVT